MDFAFSKLALVALVGLVVVGPKDLPRVARTAGRWVGRAIAVRDRLWEEVRSQANPAEEAVRGVGAELLSMRAPGAWLDGDEPWGREIIGRGPLAGERPGGAVKANGPSRIERGARASRAERRRWGSRPASAFAPRVKAGRAGA